MTPHELADPAAPCLGRRSAVAVAIAGMLSLFAAPAGAAVTIFSANMAFPAGRLAWEEQVGSWDTLDFTGLPSDTLVPPDVYSDEFGVTFENGGIFAFTSDTAFPLDGQGFAASQGSSGSSVDIVLDTPVRAFAADHPGGIRVILFSEEGGVIFSSGLLGGGGAGRFTGLISDVPFSRVRLWDTDAFGADDLRFGLAIPAPAAGFLLLPGLWLGRRRRGS